MPNKYIWDNIYYDDDKAKYLLSLERKGAFPSSRPVQRGAWIATKIIKCRGCGRWFLAKPMQRICNSKECRNRWHVKRQTVYWKKVGLTIKRAYYRKAAAVKKLKLLKKREEIKALECARQTPLEMKSQAAQAATSAQTNIICERENG